MEVVQLREDERTEAVIAELMLEADTVMAVDCADQRVGFAVKGYFVFPKGSVLKSAEVHHPS